MLLSNPIEAYLYNIMLKKNITTPDWYHLSILIFQIKTNL